MPSVHVHALSPSARVGLPPRGVGVSAVLPADGCWDRSAPPPPPLPMQKVTRAAVFIRLSGDGRRHRGYSGRLVSFCFVFFFPGVIKNFSPLGRPYGCWFGSCTHPGGCLAGVQESMQTKNTATEVHAARLLCLIFEGPTRNGGRDHKLVSGLFKGGRCFSFSFPFRSRLRAPFLPTYGLQHGNNDSKLNEGGIVNVGTGPIPSNTMALQ